jgi:parallel beta-helix repeat protein
VLSTNLWAKTHYVEKWGSNTIPCTKTAPCLTIQFAINQAKKNDKIIVGPGIYNENITINLNSGAEPLEGMKLESTAGQYGTIITAAAPANPTTSVINIYQPKVQVGKKGKGFTLTGATGRYGLEIISPADNRCKIEGNRSTGNAYGFILRGEKIQVRNNVANDNTIAGIRCISCDQALVRENRVVDNGGEGIFISDSDRASIERNFASKNDAQGFRFSSDSEFLRVRDNVSELSEFNSGFLLTDSDGALVQGNIAARNGDGASIDPGFYLLQGEFNKSPSIKNNLAVGSMTEGFLMSNLLGAKVDGNTSIQSANEGISIASGTTISSFKTNNTYDNDNSGSSCGIRNDSGSPVTYSKHFFGGGDGGCGLLNGSIATKPSPLKVKNAASL